MRITSSRNAAGVTSMNSPLRVAVAGHPLSGKSVYAESLGLPHRSTDEALSPHIKWFELSEHVSYWLDEPGPWVISGVAVPRALRKWRYRHKNDPPPLDYFVFITRPSLRNLTGPQRSMAGGIDTVVDRLRPWLARTLIDARELQNLIRLGTPTTNFFASHRCWRCDSGANLCAQGGYWRCEFPRARND